MSEDGYLQPRPADYDLDPRLKHQPEQSQPDLRQDGRQESKPRFDSGVADLEMHRLSNSPRPKSSAMYEYIDSDSHYEDVRGTLARSVSQTPNGGHDVRQSVVSESRSAMTDVTMNTDDTAAIFRSAADKKKRYNPLYQPGGESASSSYARKKKQQKQSSLERHVQVQCAFLLLLSILALAALALSLYLLVFQVMDHNKFVLSRLNSLEEINKKLSQENEALLVIVTAAGFNTSLTTSPFIKTLTNASETVLTFEEKLNSLDQQMTFTQQNVSQTLDYWTAYFNESIVKTQKMPGPQGPAGVGNLSACEYKKVTSTAVSSSSPSRTSFQPEMSQLESKVVMFAACGVEGGTGSSLDPYVITPNKVQYRCVCSGQTSSKDRICHIHLLLCPRES
ncbi:uncharacterized protein LOC124140935 isoform X1 [Haliotis rufescens]|uniref:uncharacterized protein LOC124140935 isoform X1 n=2 Tax=Haliotis rufescens TaxID=6454 RepID=UPI00201F4A0D|nr:uncharacterized protein LOC124140935 isoform X1 [Haliotis rufescens]XP_048259628.1 uncharacterized protein LOC124140935 isoform X1 [Haliotis rufescens]